MPTQQELLDFSRFDINAILRGAQLTFVGAQRALLNPGLWTTQHYRQAAAAVACGIAIRLLIEIPVIAVKVSLWLLSWFIALDTVTWDDAIADGLRFLQEYVLQVPLFLMTLMRHVTPAMDELFMSSLAWVDYTYAQKHAADHHSGDRDVAVTDPRNRYFENLQYYAQVSSKYRPTSSSSSSSSSSVDKLSPGQKGIVRFLWRFGRKAGMSLAVFALSYVPVVGRLVLPATSFLTFRRSVGLGPASLIFGLGLFLPRRYLVMFLQTYYGSRSLMRELLGPYFSRMHFTSTQKRNWFSSREGLLFGFGAGFYILLRVPLVGVLIYGIAEASAAYLVTKITDPPPGRVDFAAVTSRNAADAGALVNSFNESQQTWRNRKAFLDLALDNLDALQQKHLAEREKRGAPASSPASAAASTSTASAYEKAGQAGGAQQRIPITTPSDAPPPYTD
ncbi:transmembrane protein [Ophiostoma piceae UAMH 11346]|uniref:Transmembrane protein n=1 Tax=Ophiostoma piceae (strain UAMH 11346) TaxID=1262450 RepID=S3BVG0_OPHP1|nr:transmembrane protein [Ophiostoma piceae UAMH 11346]